MKATLWHLPKSPACDVEAVEPDGTLTTIGVRTIVDAQRLKVLLARVNVPRRRPFDRTPLTGRYISCKAAVHYVFDSNRTLCGHPARNMLRATDVNAAVTCAACKRVHKGRT